MLKTNAQVVTIDVRPEFYYGHEPFNRIMRAVAKLGPDDKLLLLSPFEPVPLCRVMAGRGYSYTASELPSGGWQVLFERETSAAEASPNGGAEQFDWMNIDVRGLEPPMPLVRVLEVLESLPACSGLVVHTDRRPVFLLDELPRRGFTGDSEQASDGNGYVTRIQRN